MAEALISFVVQRLGDALIEEAVFLKGVRGQFEQLQKELRSINGFLRTADRKRCDDSSILDWVAEVRDIAYDVDDIIDSFIIKVASKQRRVDLPKKMIYVYKIGKEIESIFDRIKKIDERRRRYGIDITTQGRDEASSSSNNAIWLRRVYPGTEDHNIIGLGEATNKLVAELMKEGGCLRVVSICGMGGLGKTTLAKRVYNHNSVRNHFDCCAWTFISQECRANNVLQEILRQVSNLSADERGKMTEVEVAEKLFEILQENRYLVVLDDIWKEDAWDMLKSAFPSGRNGSKLILTSRNANVASHADPWGFRFDPQFLNEDEAWDLICKIAFPEDDVGAGLNVSGNMEKCGREMVKKCGGLPLAIVVLGGVLARKNTLSEWEIVSKDIGQAGVSSVLALSYNDLPFHLKPLYLYLGLFPEDHQIRVKEVIGMWIAEGMVSKQGSQLTMEEIGELYMEELIHRSMIQVGSRTKLGRVKTCQLHDTMRDLIIQKASEENFFKINRSDVVLTDDSPSLRRCAIYLGKERYALSSHRIRSVLFFEGEYSSIYEIAYQDFTSTRVFGFQLDEILFDSRVVSFSGEVSQLINLRYLSLRNNRFFLQKLPKSIGNLVFLETLDVRCYYSGVRLPNVIWKMSRLRHLYMAWRTEIIGGRLRLDTLKQLQTLTGMKGEWGITDLVKLTNLRKLKAFDLTTDMAKAIVDYVVNGLDNLRSIHLWLLYGQEFRDLDRLSQNGHLLKMKLSGTMSSYPSNGWPSNLVELQLVSTETIEDPMPTLEKLQHLEYLMLYNLKCERMICSRDGFPQLVQLFFLGELEDKEWIVEKGAMPCLTTLLISNCTRLKKIPQGVKFLTKLKRLHLIGMPETFDEERVKEGGEDWQTVQHISSISIQRFP